MITVAESLGWLAQYLFARFARLDRYAVDNEHKILLEYAHFSRVSGDANPWHREGVTPRPVEDAEVQDHAETDSNAELAEVAEFF